MNRRRATALLTLGVIAALQPRVLRAGGLSVDGAAVAGSLLPYREGLPVVHWDAGLAAGCAAWAAHQAEQYKAAPDTFTYVHSKAWAAQECIYAGKREPWPVAFQAWIESPDHLSVLQHTRAVRVGLGGVQVEETRRHWPRVFWVLRVQEDR